MVRAAAKNYNDVTVITSRTISRTYNQLKKIRSTSLEFRKKCLKKLLLKQHIMTL